MINFVQKNERADENLSKVRRWVMAITTGVLVLYIVGIVGFLGWGAYWARRQTKDSTQVDQLTAQITGLAEQEAVVRKLIDRLAYIKQFLDSRSDITTLAEVTESDLVIVKGWTFDPLVLKVKVSGKSSEEIKTYAEEMKTKFVNVQMDSLEWSSLNGWVGNISLKGLKKS